MQKHTFELEAPFGTVNLEVVSDRTLEVVEDDTVDVSPMLSAEMRVNGCRKRILLIKLEAKQPIELGISCALRQGFDSYVASGQFFNAWDVTSERFKGCFGTRDQDWFEQVHGFENGRSCTRAITLPIEFSSAWTINPTNETETISAWFAADLVLK